MRHESVIAELRKHAKATTARTYRRHGVQDEVLGVSYADMKALLKRLGTDHDLARGLWKSGIHEARVIATKVADAARLTRAEAERWLKQSSDYVVVDAVSGLAAQAGDALEWSGDWVKSSSEWVSAAGWNVVGLHAMDGRLPVAAAKRLIVKIRRGIRKAANRTRYAMNGALISIGGSMPELTELAVDAAREIGPVEVDHGQTSCKTPDALSYIPKMAARARGRTRTRVTGARMRSTARRRG